MNTFNVGSDSLAYTIYDNCVVVHGSINYYGWDYSIYLQFNFENNKWVRAAGWGKGITIPRIKLKIDIKTKEKINDVILDAWSNFVTSDMIKQAKKDKITNSIKDRKMIVEFKQQQIIALNREIRLFETELSNLS